jgi:hypothetical protein
MATVNKDFKIKSGLIVEGSTATVGGYDVLTKKQADQDYVVGLIGGTATSANEANKVVKRDANGNFAAGTITANITGDVTGDVTGTVSDISNHSTTGLSEGTNLYFTNQRAVDANFGLWDSEGSAAQALSDANDHTDSAISTEVTNRNSAIATAKGEAISSANGYTDGEITSALTTAQGYANDAETDANSYTDGKISTEVTDRNSAITSAINTEVTDRNSAIATAKAQAIADAASYTDAEVAALVNQAPELLDTLNELAAAIADNPNYATDAAAAVAGRVAKSGDTMTGDLVLPGAPTLDLHASTKKYVDDQAYLADMSARGYADGVAGTAETDANSYTDGEITSALVTAQGYADDAEAAALAAAALDATSKADSAESDANAYTDSSISTEVTNRNNAITSAVNALTTSDIEEGTNSYFTDVRAKTSAAALIVGATKTNITITGDENGLTISAENGVADSTTNDLTEGSTNKYFTAQRAVDALEAVVPNFTAVELNSVAKQVASTLDAATAGVQTAQAWAKADYRSAEFLVKVAYGDHTEISKVLVTLDINDNIAMTEYGVVGTNGSASSISANISGNNVQLQVTTANNNSTVTVVGTLLA